jgi:hypothetical protein
MRELISIKRALIHELIWRSSSFMIQYALYMCLYCTCCISVCLHTGSYVHVTHVFHIQLTDDTISPLHVGLLQCCV